MCAETLDHWCATSRVETSRVSGSLIITLPLDATDEERAEAVELAYKCVKPGGQIVCDEPYTPGVDVIRVRIDPESEWGRTIRRLTSVPTEFSSSD